MNIDFYLDTTHYEVCNTVWPIYKKHSKWMQHTYMSSERSWWEESAFITLDDSKINKSDSKVLNFEKIF